MKKIEINFITQVFESAYVGTFKNLNDFYKIPYSFQKFNFNKIFKLLYPFNVIFLIYLENFFMKQISILFNLHYYGQLNDL